MSITWIGVLTAVIGDVASAFGCSVGLLDSVTAIAFVALGTSVPGASNGSALFAAHFSFRFVHSPRFPLRSKARNQQGLVLRPLA